MPLTDAQILELEELLKLQKIDLLNEGLTRFNDLTNPNYKVLYNAITTQKWGYDDKGKPKLLKGYAGAVLEGGTRSGKTWSGVDTIIYLTTIKHKKEGCSINIYRETYNEFKTTLYDDFKTRLDDFGLDNPFHRAKEVKSFRIGKSTVNFLGDGKFGGACDYAFFNEVMFIEHKVFMQVVIRCRYFWWMDFNPCFTDHWVFNSVIPRPDVIWIKTTFLDNPYVTPNALNETLNTEPWESGTYQVTPEGELLYKGKPIDDANQPPINLKNANQNTIDEFFWKVFGLGLRGAMKGVIFEQLEWIEKFPDMEYIYANDFGFTNDPNAFGKYTEDEHNIWVELLIYKPIDTPEELALGYEALGVEKDRIIACDSSDKYSGEKGTVEMVRGLNNLGYKNAFKISKTKDVMYWIASVKKKKLHVVKNHLWKAVKKERENYKFKEINGILINQPIDKHNHFFDKLRYGHIAWNSKPKTHVTTQSLSDMGIDY
ncbi:phage terminase large subunit [uncultured Wocania sp.]|uniref:phage terminase large subunit n=1 Tax=uncultured Wocania sp. TaxID=2834404 RepID=UPI0030FA1B4E